MRVFVSLVVWLFSVKGADGALTITPENYVLVKGSVATLRCASNATLPGWFYQAYRHSHEKDIQEATDEACRSVVESFDAASPGPHACDLTVKDSPEQATWMFMCSDGDHQFHAIMIFIESTLKCAILDNQLGCTMVHSAYNNQTEISIYISNHLIWKSDTGEVVADVEAGNDDTTTVAKADIPSPMSVRKPYVCSAVFKMEGELEDDYSPVVNIVPGGKLECKFPQTAADEEEAKAAAEAAAAKSKAGKTSNDKLERDGIIVIAMLMSLVAAFLDH